MNADTIRRLAAIDMPAEALREVLSVFADIEADHEERRARDAARKKADREAKKATSADCPRTVRGLSSGSPAEVPHAPAPAPAEFVLTSLDSLPSKENPPKGGQKKGFRRQISEDEQPTDRDQLVAERLGMSPETFRLEWQKWRGHHVSEAKPLANIHQSWIKWASNWVSYGCRQADGKTNGKVFAPVELGNRIFVIRDSPQWDAWTKALGKPKPTTQRGQDEGWYFETEWPPDETINSPFEVAVGAEKNGNSCAAAERGSAWLSPAVHRQA